ncbi:hypothetical protein PR048_015476 [Dryococelus australis]|uniref:Uncharacterized protein n=1 Tax=Dryococelus australis TaxID=614101 RepID=A0ABQ9HH48_9NEOP|nr:hypothetical protein PR048_015476 [Dryococelus australis]
MTKLSSHHKCGMKQTKDNRAEIVLIVWTIGMDTEEMATELKRKSSREDSSKALRLKSGNNVSPMRTDLQQSQLRQNATGVLNCLSNEVTMEQLRNEWAEETGDPRENPPTRSHRPARFLRAEIRERPRRGSNPIRLGERRLVYPPHNRGPAWPCVQYVTDGNNPECWRCRVVVGQASFSPGWTAVKRLTWMTPPPLPPEQARNSLGRSSILPNQSSIITSSSVHAGLAICNTHETYHCPVRDPGHTTVVRLLVRRCTRLCSVGQRGDVSLVGVAAPWLVTKVNVSLSISEGLLAILSSTDRRDATFVKGPVEFWIFNRDIGSRSALVIAGRRKRVPRSVNLNTEGIKDDPEIPRKAQLQDPATLVTHPAEADAGDGAAEHVSDNGGVGVGGWEVGVKLRRVPMCHLQHRMSKREINDEVIGVVRSQPPSNLVSLRSSSRDRVIGSVASCAFLDVQCPNCPAYQHTAHLLKLTVDNVYKWEECVLTPGMMTRSMSFMTSCHLSGVSGALSGSKGRIEVFRANEGVEISMDQRWNERAEETGVPRENPASSGTIPKCENPGSPWWAASRLTTQSLRLPLHRFPGRGNSPADEGKMNVPRREPATFSCRNNVDTRYCRNSDNRTALTKDEVDRSRWMRATSFRVPTLNCFSADTTSKNGVDWICGQIPRPTGGRNSLVEPLRQKCGPD